MSEGFLADAINSSRKSARKRRILLVTISLLVVTVLVVGTTYAYSTIKHSHKQKPAPPVVGLDYGSSKVTQKTTSKKPAVETPVKPVTNSSSQNPPAQADATATLQKECEKLIDSFDTYMDSLDKQYYDAWKSWNNDFAGRYDTQDAEDAKQWFKDYFHKRYSDNVSSTSPTATKLCGYDPGLQYRHPEPDYNAWQ